MNLYPIFTCYSSKKYPQVIQKSVNILLDDLDKELEKRGHHFVGYADDFIIMVKSITKDKLS